MTGIFLSNTLKTQLAMRFQDVIIEKFDIELIDYAFSVFTPGFLIAYLS